MPTKDEDWPKLVEILDFQSRVRARLRALYDDIESGKRPLTRRMARVLMLTLEHEGFHAEVCCWTVIILKHVLMTSRRCFTCSYSALVPEPSLHPSQASTHRLGRL